MKKLYFLPACALTVLLSCEVYAQEKEDPGESQEKTKVETIKIINGDTVVHDVTYGEDALRHHNRVIINKSKGEEDIEIDMEMIMDEMNEAMEQINRSQEIVIKKIEIADGEIVETEMELEDLDETLKELDEKLQRIKIEYDMNSEDANGMKYKYVIIDEDEQVISSGGDSSSYEQIKVVVTDDGNKIMKVKVKGNESEVRIESDGKSGITGADDLALNLYPNPAKEAFNLEFTLEEDEKTEVTVTDMQGKEIFNKTYRDAGKYREKIEVDDLSSGIYLINLKQKRRSISKKVVIE